MNLIRKLKSEVGQYDPMGILMFLVVLVVVIVVLFALLGHLH
jgi:hypothetical protein